MSYINNLSPHIHTLVHIHIHRYIHTGSHTHTGTPPPPLYPPCLERRVVGELPGRAVSRESAVSLASVLLLSSSCSSSSPAPPLSPVGGTSQVESSESWRETEREQESEQQPQSMPVQTMTTSRAELVWRVSHNCVYIYICAHTHWWNCGLVLQITRS